MSQDERLRRAAERVKGTLVLNQEVEFPENEGGVGGGPPADRLLQD